MFFVQFKQNADQICKQKTRKKRLILPMRFSLAYGIFHTIFVTSIMYDNWQVRVCMCTSCATFGMHKSTATAHSRWLFYSGDLFAFPFFIAFNGHFFPFNTYFLQFSTNNAIFSHLFIVVMNGSRCVCCDKLRVYTWATHLTVIAWWLSQNNIRKKERSTHTSAAHKRMQWCRHMDHVRPIDMQQQQHFTVSKRMCRVCLYKLFFQKILIISRSHTLDH